MVQISLRDPERLMLDHRDGNNMYKTAKSRRDQILGVLRQEGKVVAAEHDEKQVIAGKAAQLIQNASVVFMDGGTSAVEVVRAVDPQLQFTMITHNPRAALALVEKGGSAEVILLGGRIDRHELVTMSPSTIPEIRKFRADLFFMGICSIHPSLGITCRTLEDLELKRAMAEASAEVVGLATAHKLGTVAPMVLGPVSMLRYLITDAASEMVLDYGRFGVTIC
jgi:DeoR/GlpR family transcriptional regulator of sugar metabolism